MEVITRTFEMVLRGSEAGNVKTLLDKDPEMLDFALGVLFRYDPPDP